MSAYRKRAATAPETVGGTRRHQHVRLLSAANTMRAISGTAAALSLTACSGSQSALDVRGPAAARIADLWWLMLAVASVVYLGVLALLLAAAVRRRREDDDRRTGGSATEGSGKRWIFGGGVALPAIVLAAMFAVTLRTQSALDPHAAADLKVQVIGRQWWWEIRYPSLYPSLTPGDTIITANELHLPTGRRVRLELTSADVIHSLWVPNLQGKTDLVPGRTTVTWLQADQPGTSRGQCAEFCGIQHARMALMVIAEPPAQFARWLDEQRRPAVVPADEPTRRGQGIFLNRGCAYCHAVRGMLTPGLLGPDLTHFASRQTIAAGTLTNTRANLAAWIADPQHLKPGNKMPRVPLAPEELQAVVSYLQSVR